MSSGSGKRDAVIVTCAITGSIHTPSMSPYLPITPEEIASEAGAAADAGAAILHLHARSPVDGRPTQDPRIYAKFLPSIKGRTDAVINITTGGAVTLSLEERLAPAKLYAPEIASLNMGSMNFGLFPMLNRHKEFKFDWERPYLENRDIVFRNTFKDISYILDQCGANGTRFECECYDISHLYTLDYFLSDGLIKPPLLVQSVFGLLGGIGAHSEDILHMKRTADRLFGKDYVWSVLGAGRHQLKTAIQSVSMGGHVRVGLEDSLWSGPGRLAKSNAEQVLNMRRLIESLGLSVATPDEARELLMLKGSDKVKF